MADLSIKVGDQPSSSADVKDPEAAIELRYSLCVLGLIPHFLTPSSRDVVPRTIDVSLGVKLLRGITRLVEAKDMAGNCGKHEKRKGIVWRENTAVKMWYFTVYSHVESLSASDEAKLLPSDWTGIFATIELYQNCVIKLCNAGMIMEEQRLGQILVLVERDLRRTKSCLEKPISGESDLWFWKVFVGVLSISRLGKCLSEKLRALRHLFGAYIREWAGKFEVESWDEARKSLESIAWPSSTREEERFLEAWYKATQVNQRSMNPNWDIKK